MKTRRHEELQSVCLSVNSQWVTNIIVNSMDAEAIVNSPERGFLGHLAPSIPRHPYQGKDQYLQYYEKMYQQCLDDDDPENISSYFLVTQITESAFLRDFPTDFDRSYPFSRWISFDPALDLLLVRMGKSRAHALAAGVFEGMMFEALEPTGMTRRHLDLIDSATCYAGNGNKEADKAWLPVRMPRGRSRDWPSAVLEVAYSETTSKLQSDIRYWFRASGGDVGLVYTIEISRVLLSIIIEQWGTNDSGRHHREQLVVIKKKGEDTVVEGGPLVLGFEKLFLRAPGGKERDVEIGEEGFAFLADRVWTAQREEKEIKERERDKRARR
ncbi:hypothetical protein BJX70DRAFT_385009, partial [Aspergillus crustosus]